MDITKFEADISGTGTSYSSADKNNDQKQDTNIVASNLLVDPFQTIQRNEDATTSYEGKLSHKMQSNIVSSQTQFGSIALNNSKNVMFGDKAIYQGPVTINQYLLNKQAAENKGESGSAKSKSQKIFRCFKNGSKKRQKLKTKYVVIGVALMSTICILVVIIICTVTPQPQHTNNPSTFIFTASHHNGTDFDIIHRDEWLAQPAKSAATLKVPVSTVIIAHTAGGQCFNKSDCTYIVQNIQNYHIHNRGFTDIAYNFLVAGNGLIYEGRGWEKPGVHTPGFNNKSICIAFLGKFSNVEPPEVQMNATQFLIMDGLKNQKVTADYKLFGQRQLIATESPGLSLYKLIRKWPHWSDEID